jgi:hypothetical protein
MSDWSFNDPPDVMTITARAIIEDGHPVLYVVHDAADGTWQFLTGGRFVPDDARLVRLDTMIRLDPTLGELADLPLGWEATRTGAREPWQRTESEYEDT